MKTRLFSLLAGAAALALATTAASAADLPSRAAPAPFIAAVPVFTWTGFYVGAQAGYAWGEDETSLFFDGDAVDLGGIATDSDGFVGGVHAGYNVQVGSFVVGVEGDVEAAGIEGDLAVTSPAFPGASASVESEINFQGSIRARAGVAFDRALVYVTGGLAFANTENTYSATLPAGNPLGVPAGTYSESVDDTEWGWTIGAGVEYAFTNNLTARVEYRYTKFDDVEASTDFIPGGSAEQDPEFHTIRVGVSYKFGTY